MATLTADKTYTINGVTVKDYLLTEHNPNSISLPSKRMGTLAGVTIHNTDTIKVSGTTMSEQYTRATVNGNMDTVRVHYYVDGTEAWHNLPDTWQSWHAGQKGKADANGSAVGNQQTISIECIMGGTTGYEAAEDNAARLAAYLLQTNGLTIDNLYTHNYWCNVRNGKTGTVDELNLLNDGYKGCPVYIRPHWAEFKAKVQEYMTALSAASTAESQKYYVQVGAFASKANAEAYLAKVKSDYPNAFIKVM
jgi:N-acetylmuramoyl-L-alanine amidase CwlA